MSSEIEGGIKMAKFEQDAKQLLEAIGGSENVAAVLAIWWLHRGNKEEEQISIPATISCYLGVTEPALFGINLKYIYPFVAGMIGSAIAGFVATNFNVTANTVGIGGLPGILVIQPDSMAMFAICMVIAIVVPFVLTVIFEKRQIFTK